jgi:hypothetical protein
MWRSRGGRTVALVLPWLISFSAAAQDGARRVEVTGTRVSMVPPSAFEVADRFPGFVGPNGASIHVTEIAGPFKEVTAGFSDPELAKKQGMTILAPPQSITLADGTQALWFQFRQDYLDERFRKWAVAWGNSSATVMLIGTVPESDAAGGEARFKQSFLTATWKPAPPSTAIDTAGLPFTIRPAPGWEFVQRVGASVGVALAGTRLPDTTGNPRLIAAASTQTVSGNQLAGTAAALFKTFTPDLYLERVVRTSRPIRIAGQPAHEVVGTARHTSGYSVALYLVLVDDGVGHLQFVGMCRLDDETRYLPAFRQMVENLSLGKQ